MQPCHFALWSYHYLHGIPEMMRLLLPRVSFPEYPSNNRAKGAINLVDDHYKWVWRGLTTSPTSLSKEAIDKVKPFESLEPYIVIHAVSSGPERIYKDFPNVDLTGVNYKIIGYPGQNGGLKGDVFMGTFLEIASLLRGSKGLLCIDSCPLHMANLLACPSVAIYHSNLNYSVAPNNGPGLIRPHPDTVAHHARALFRGDYDNYSETVAKEKVLKTTFVRERYFSL